MDTEGRVRLKEVFPSDIYGFQRALPLIQKRYLVNRASDIPKIAFRLYSSDFDDGLWAIRSLSIAGSPGV